MEELRGIDLVKVFPDGTRALDRASFAARTSRILVLLGPSGCGKSTLLRIVAGLERATSGTLELDGRAFDALPPGRREVGFVFQNYALYPHLSVEGNLALSLKVRRLDREEIARRVTEVASLLGIADLLARRPSELSGGQQQRVALGRALVRRPQLYLLDEPLSNLDALLRERMRGELKGLFRGLGATVIHVTHDQTEAMSLADEIAVMRAGRVLQCAPPLDVYARPAALFVATFVGSPRMTVWTGPREDDRLVCRDVTLPVPEGLTAGRRLSAGIRPEHVQIAEAPMTGAMVGRLALTEPLGPQTLLTLRIGGEKARALAAPREWPERLWVRFPPEHLHWFDAQTERRVEPSRSS